jgi:hypothetical protein
MNQKQGLKLKIHNTTKGWGRLQDKDCYILRENALKIHEQLHKVRLNAYHQPQAG